MGASTDNQSLAQELRELVNQRLAVLIAETGSNDPLTSALRHSLLAPGKRVRPLICLMSAQCLGASYEAALDPACAIEMVHTASLIIDDLPSMDDAHMRRGRPACHQHFGEATAILAALELLSLGYRVMSAAPGVDSERRMQLVQILARAVGIKGLIGGQERDLAVVKDPQVGSMGTESVTRTHELKTSSLFIAAAESGATVAGLEGGQLVSIREFAARLGLAYQAMDDLLDVRGTVSTAGKDVGKDGDKPTLVGVLGENEAAAYANNMLAGAMAALQPLGSGMQPLENLVQSMLAGSISSGSNVRH